MVLEAFFCIVLSFWAISAFMKSLEKNKRVRDNYKANHPPIKYKEVTPEELAEQLASEQARVERDKDVNELRKQGYTDELIAVILPTIRNGQ